MSHRSSSESSGHSLFSNRQLQVCQAAAARAATMKAESMKNTWDLSGLPSDRNLEHHPHSIMYALYSDTSKIAPVWTKLSHTAFQGRSRLLGGGYGRKMQVRSYLFQYSNN